MVSNCARQCLDAALTGTTIAISENTADENETCLDEVFTRVENSILGVGDVQLLKLLETNDKPRTALCLTYLLESALQSSSDTTAPVTTETNHADNNDG